MRLIKDQVSVIQKTIDVTFKFLSIVVGREARNLKGDSKVISTKK